jgi:hypothetical protein
VKKKWKKVEKSGKKWKKSKGCKNRDAFCSKTKVKKMEKSGKKWKNEKKWRKVGKVEIDLHIKKK